MAGLLKAVFFDFGGTLFDYQVVARADLETQIDALGWAGVQADEEAVKKASKEAMRRVFQRYLPQPFYLHGDLFRDALAGLFDSFAVPFRPNYYDRYRSVLMSRYARDLRLRDDAIDTLRKLGEAELVLGLVSNIDENQLAFLVELTGLAPHFAFTLSSERARSCKPDPGIFEQAVRLARCRVDQSLFVGDTVAQDVVGANRAGMASVLLWHRNDPGPPENGPKPRHKIRRISEILEIVADYR